MVSSHNVSRVLETDGAGMLHASRVLNGLCVWLSQNDVRLAAYTPVEEIDADHGRIRLADGWVEADLVVVAAGAWVLDLVPDLHSGLNPSRQSVLYLAPPDNTRQPGRKPLSSSTPARNARTMPCRPGMGRA
ncbi:FAD-dependent oxidoreductase [Mesorhizobium sp. M2E.F.Ca.ET.166.01.1.1]|nr:FAD-dependent oxidoreductase [Mesorhizobium sp. M2E.F.Ca.ET.166.01.1.1]TGV99397.1 FAD-dependent oxidoreductase [Mesorhizobium sp. M2E.F.Ca.ET.154.01.1.1]